ncbi:MarR family winged helix-turn-helix transcriptional regulator [Amycolatopsis orientalis]|uniref:MarR family winged helix-turn-helix transcriptional regulator n=1 Tax=Amycolatopsis orientalis TaxID=31958 RepID=UPI0003A90827|nr:MarR family transcriptional regulator [Amycolatopsis orientalis]
MPEAKRDVVAAILDQWRAERPEVDYAGVEVWARIARVGQVADRQLRELQARHGLEPWEYDVLAALRRAGKPYELTAGELTKAMLVVSGTITNRVDRMAARGLVQRTASRRDRRSTLVRLTRAGLTAIDEAMPTLAAGELDLLSGLTAAERDRLALLLRRLLLSLGDRG